MRQKSVPATRVIETSYFKVDSDLMARIRDTKVVIFRAVCDGKWAKTRVALLENKERNCRWKTMNLDVEMPLARFYETIMPGREIVFYEKDVLDSGEAEVAFTQRRGPVIHEGPAAVFRVDKIVCNDRFRLRNCLSDGPENDME